MSFFKNDENHIRSGWKVTFVIASSLAIANIAALVYFLVYALFYIMNASKSGPVDESIINSLVTNIQSGNAVMMAISEIATIVTVLFI